MITGAFFVDLKKAFYLVEDECLLFKVEHYRGRAGSPGGVGGDAGVLRIMAYTGRLRPKGRLQIYERVGILPVEVYERVRKSVIWVCERAHRANR